MPYYKAIKTQDLLEGQGVEVLIQGKSIALFNKNGNFYAIDNLCPHQGASLAEGEISGNEVTCPWHAWQFDITTGENLENPEIKVHKYNVKVEKDDLLVEID